MRRDEQAVATLENIRAGAIIAADIAVLDAMTGDDYVHVDGDGALRDKTGFLAALSNRGGRFTAYRIIDNRIAVNGDVAIVTGSFANEYAADDGMIRTKHGRHVRLYLRDGEQWRNVLHQGTEIRE